MKKELEPAFARPHSEDADFVHHAQAGMTLRDYFAAKALISWYCNKEDEASQHPDSVAIWCYQLADAMMKAREQA